MLGVFAYIFGSVIVIFILHHLYDYMSKLCAPQKVKRMSELYSKKYHDIHETLQNSMQPLLYSADNIDVDAEIFASDVELAILVNGLDMENNGFSTNGNDTMQLQ